MMLEITTLLVQIGAILITARLVGWLLRTIHQPQVIGEMVAGILLGPSLLGWLAPGVSAAIFPPASLTLLNMLSQVGLIIYMFVVGLELNPSLLKQKKHAAIVTSHVSIIVPFLLGALLALYLYPRLSDSSVKFSHFVLFLGISMSITAFPVLARILTDRNLARGGVGAVAITCAAVDDITAWCMLAGLILFVRAGNVATELWSTVLGTIAYIGLMLIVIRPVLSKSLAWYRRRTALDTAINRDMLAIILLMVLASAWITENLGIHALFGAFLVGAIMPKEERFIQALRDKLGDLIVVLLLPLFFALTGLRTSITLVSGGEMWFWCGLIIAVAIIGKLGGAMAASRMTGLPWREAAAVGILMNTRGLMELVALNIGLDIGVISPPLFTMLVLMALVTTFMTTPLLDLFYVRRLAAREADYARDSRYLQNSDRGPATGTDGV